MPENPSDDPFADLFGKLPDPRSRALRSPEQGSGTAQGSDQATDAAPPVPPRPAPAPPRPEEPAAPLSRRAAREAAARETAAVDGDAPDDVPSSPSSPVPVSRTEDVYGARRTVPDAAETGAPAYARTTRPSEPEAPAAPSAPARRTTAESPTTPAPQAAAAAPAPDPRAVQAPAAAPRATEPTEAPRRTTAEPRTERKAAASSPGLEDLFAGTATTEALGDVPPPKNKRRRRVGGWIALGVVLVLLGGVAAGGWYVWSTYEDNIRAFMGWEEPKDFEAGLANGEAFLTIASGDTGQPISSKLFEAGVTKTDDAFYSYLVDEGLNPPFVPGVFRLQKQMTSAAALEAILDPANKLENSAQLREGLTVEQSLPLLAEGIGLPIEDFQAAVANPADYGVDAATLEGWLFPATYTFDPGVTARDVIARLVSRTTESLDAAGVPAEDRERILTIASIIQREARFEADMQKVSTVIENRLDPTNQETFGYLQMDSTAQYGYGEMHDGTASSSQEALDDVNDWNTYQRQGLPVGPISNPGDTAIAAAMSPAEGDWLYFVTVNLDTGETVFTTNLADHNRAVEQWVSWCRDNPDSGC